MKRLALLLALVLLLTGCAASRTPKTEDPFGENGDAILSAFTTEGLVNIYDSETNQWYTRLEGDILIHVPQTLDPEGFHMTVQGILPNGTLEVLYTEADIVPGCTLTIPPETYHKYRDLHLALDYFRDGKYLSYRNVDLFTGTSDSYVPYHFAENTRPAD